MKKAGHWSRKYTYIHIARNIRDREKDAFTDISVLIWSFNNPMRYLLLFQERLNNKPNVTWMIGESWSSNQAAPTTESWPSASNSRRWLEITLRSFCGFFFLSEEIYPTYFPKTQGSLKIKTQRKRRRLRITLLLKKAKEIDGFRHLSQADSSAWVLNLVLTFLTAKPKREAYWVAYIFVFLTIDSIHMHLWRQNVFLELNLGIHHVDPRIKDME